MGSYLSQPIRTKSSGAAERDRFVCAFSGVQGWRVSMEDAHFIHFGDDGTAVFGVFDGHGGREVAMYAAQNFPSIFENSSGFQKGDISQALIESFLRTDEDMLKPEGEDVLTKFGNSDGPDGSAAGGGGSSSMFLARLLAQAHAVAKRKTPVSDGTGEGRGGDGDDDDDDDDDIGISFGNGNDQDGHSGHRGKKGHRSGAKKSPKRLAQESGTPTIKENEHVKIRAVEGDSVMDGDVSKDASDASAATGPKKSAKPAHPKKRVTELDPETGAELNDSNEDDEEDNVLESDDSDDDVNDEDEDEEDEDGDEEDEEDMLVHPVPGEDEAVPLQALASLLEGGQAIFEDPMEDEGMRKPAVSTNISNSHPARNAGATAIVAVVRNGILYVGNAGDSRCVISRTGGECVDMSIDHKPMDDTERNRILAAGGFLTAEGRVCGNLNLSRALGDFQYKMNAELRPEEQIISAYPDIQQAELRPDDEFLVLACDGIWNSMTSPEVVDFVRDRLMSREYGRETAAVKIGKTADHAPVATHQQKVVARICEDLCDICMAPTNTSDGIGMDNETVIIVILNRELFPALQE